MSQERTSGGRQFISAPLAMAINTKNWILEGVRAFVYECNWKKLRGKWKESINRRIEQRHRGGRKVVCIHVYDGKDSRPASLAA